MNRCKEIEIGGHDALIVVDVQNDFLPGGALAVIDGNMIVPVINCWLRLFKARNLPVFATADWHPADHCSFRENGGQWPKHCVAGSNGARFARELELHDEVFVIRKGTDVEKEAYSGFQGTDLKQQLDARGITRVFIGGLATDYCVLNTVDDALAGDFDVVLLKQAIRAVNLNPADGDRAIESMLDRGAILHVGPVLAG